MQLGHALRVSRCCSPSVATGLASDIAPTGTLRAAYLANNPAQAVRDPASGEIRGASADLARELGRRIGAPVTLIPSTSPQAVIDAVSKGDADIGFVAYAPSRTGTVDFSQTYMLVRQSFLVPENSPIRSVAISISPVVGSAAGAAIRSRCFWREPSNGRR